MKKQLIAVTAIASLMLGAAIAQGSDSKGAGIVGSVHDMNSVGSIYGVGDPGQRICAFCHSPHHSLQDNKQDAASVANLAGTGVGATYKIYAPLWSRTDLPLSSNPYVSQTFNPGSKGKAYDPLIGPSRLCLSCHDGTVAIDNYYGNTAPTANATGDAFNGPLGGGDLGSIGVGGGMTGLGNDHPIGMKYTDYQTDTDNYELNTTDKKFQTTGGTAGKSIAQVLYSDPQDNNVKDFVTCASCHDVHNGKAVGNNSPKGSMRGFLLYGSQVNSSFCLTCHDKNNGTIPSGQ